MKQDALRRDIVEWDVINWSRAIDAWGLAEGPEVVCSDLTNPRDSAGPLHEKYGVQDRVTYRALDATALQESETYDIVCFKSVLGGVGANDNLAAQRQMIQNIYQALKPGGILLFAENLTATAFHRFCRSHFNKWSYWRYITLDETQDFCRQFQSVQCHCFGFLATFGRSERQREILGQIDSVLDRLLPEKSKYIVSVAARK